MKIKFAIHFPIFIFIINTMKLEEELGQILKEKHLTIATAESCTGGLVS